MTMKAGGVFKQFAVAGLICAISILSACGSGNSSNSNSSDSTGTASSNANAGAVETKNKDTSPVTIKISDLFKEAESTSAGSMMQAYSNRQMTVTGGVLYELNSDNAKVGNGQNPDFGVESSAPQYFVTCKGTVPDYTPDIAESVDKWRKAGQAKIFTVKGVFKEYGSYNNKNWVILDQCAVVKS
jgi:hypothetical protein